MELHEALSLRKKELDISFDELSAKSKVPINTLKKIFTGVTVNPGISTVKSIVYAMGMSLQDLDDRIKHRESFSREALLIAQQYDDIDAEAKAFIRTALKYALTSQNTPLDDHDRGYSPELLKNLEKIIEKTASSEENAERA